MQVYIIATLATAVVAGLAGRYIGEKLIADNRQLSVIRIKGIKLHFYTLLTIVPLWLVAGVRSSVGTDYTAYMVKHIPAALSNDYSVNIEPLYRLLIKISVGLFKDYQSVFIITALIFTTFFIKFILSESKDITWSIVLLLFTGTFTYSMNVMRQMIGVAISLYALQYLRRHDKRYIVLVIIATLFHKTSFVFLLLWFTQTKKINWKNWTFISVILILGARAITAVIERGLLSLGGYYGNYFNSRFDYGSSSVLIALNVCIFAVAILCDKKKADDNRPYIVLQYMTLLVLAMGLPNNTRLCYMFIPAQCVYFTRICDQYRCSKWFYYLMRVMITGIYMAFFYYFFYLNNIGATFPYKTIWG